MQKRALLLAWVMTLSCSRASPDEIDERMPAGGGWHIIRFYRIPTPPDRQFSARLPDYSVRVGGSARTPQLIMELDNPCGKVPTFAYRVLRQGEIEMRALGNSGTAETCPAVWSPEIRAAKLPPLRRGRWQVAMTDTTLFQSGATTDLR